MADSKGTNPARKWRPSPPELIVLFEKLIEAVPGAQPRKMFGYPCAFVNGNMFTGLHQENLMLRLSEEDRATLLSIKGAAPFEPMPGRAMKEYVTVPDSMLKKQAELKKWLARSFGYANSLPPKVKKQPAVTKNSAGKNPVAKKQPAAKKQAKKPAGPAKKR
ncbi:MAG: TfoX/Sxy family protein [Actinobacteria bacterium]|nr:TfoX/Sxy family protein [Actinomycetota bacterium]